MKWARKAYIEAQAKEAMMHAPAIVVTNPNLKMGGDLMEELKHLNLEHFADKVQVVHTPALKPAPQHPNKIGFGAVGGSGGASGGGGGGGGGAWPGDNKVMKPILMGKMKEIPVDVSPHPHEMASGVQLTDAGPVLVTGQDDPKDNGVYTVALNEPEVGIDWGHIAATLPLNLALDCLSQHGIMVKAMSTNIEASYGHSEVTLELHLVGGDALPTLKAIQDWSMGKKFKVG